MIGLLVFGFGFVLGTLNGQGKLIPWVRGAAGKARELALGVAPARPQRQASLAPTPTPNDAMGDLMGDPASKPIEVSPTPPKNPIRAGQALKNILAFFGGLLAWMAKNPMLAIGIVLLVLFLTLGRSCVRLPQVGDLFKSRDTIIAERDNANTNTEVAQHETRVEHRGAELADETHRDARRREEVIAQAEQEFSDAVSQADFDRLHSAYERATAGVWSGLELEGEPDHSPRGSDPVRRSSADSA